MSFVQEDKLSGPFTPVVFTNDDILDGYISLKTRLDESMEGAIAELQKCLEKSLKWTEDEVLADDYESPSAVAICVEIDQDHFDGLHEAYGDNAFPCYWKVSKQTRWTQLTLPEQRSVDL